MKIVDLLKTDDLSFSLRLTVGSRWLVWDEVGKFWVVYERKPFTKTTVKLIETTDEEHAVAVLVGRQ